MEYGWRIFLADACTSSADAVLRGFQSGSVEEAIWIYNRTILSSRGITMMDPCSECIVHFIYGKLAGVHVDEIAVYKP